jgi:predicted PurR-regulated permease PerM
MKLEKIFLPAIIIIAISWLLLTIKSILSPFIFSAIIAYLFSPVILKLEKFGLTRSTSSAIILILFFTILATIFTNLLPSLFLELSHFLKKLPTYIDNLLIKISSFLNIGLKDQLIDSGNVSEILSFSDNIFSNIANSTNVAIDVVASFAITPIITFYFLKDWEKMISSIQKYLPTKYKKRIGEVVTDVDQVISRYLRGQLTVCLILSLIYSISLNYLGLNYGFLIGIITGILSFIPYVGMLIGVSSAYIVALFQWGFIPMYFGLIAIIFIIGQIVESNYFTPKLVGDQVGIHPVWIIFGLFVFGILFGFIGLLMAIPLTAISKILLQYYAKFYRKKYIK